MVNKETKVISYLEYCRIKDDLQRRIDEALNKQKLEKLDCISHEGQTSVYISDTFLPHKMKVNFSVKVNITKPLTGREVRKLSFVLDDIGRLIEAVNKEYEGYKFEF